MSPSRFARIGVAVTLIALVGCTSESATEPAARLDTPATTNPTQQPATESPPTTQLDTTPASNSPTTTGPPTTVTLPTVVSLPQPEAPPVDDETPEPVIPLGSIAIPAIGIERPLFEGIRMPTFDLGPGHWPGTAMPGQIGNMVIGGHRTEGHADFGDLDQLRAGDQVVVTDTAGTSHTYQVTSTDIIDPFAAQMINQTPQRTATLFACHPKGSTDQRIIVHLTLTA